MFHIDFNGRLGKDAEIIDGKHGRFMALAIAVDTFKNGQKETVWVNARCGSEKHLKLREYLRKGKLLHINGSMADVGVWIDGKGIAHGQLNISVESLEFVNSGRKDEMGRQPLASPSEVSSPEAGNTEDELPF